MRIAAGWMLMEGFLCVVEHGTIGVVLNSHK